MRKFLIAFATIALVAVFLFAFAACNQGDNVSRGWVASIKTGINMTATVSFLAGETEDDLLWRAFVNTGGMEQGYDQGANNNNNWCNGHYYFDGEPGKSTLHMMLYDHDAYVEATGDTGTDITNTYDPSNVRLLDENGKRVDFNTYIDIEPDEDGGYTFTFVLVPISFAEKANFTATIIPPQDGTMGSGGEAVYAPEPEGLNFVETVVAIAVPVGVVVIAGIVVAVILVKKNKKKKAAAAAAENGEGDISPDDGSEA